MIIFCKLSMLNTCVPYHSLYHSPYSLLFSAVWGLFYSACCRYPCLSCSERLPFYHKITEPGSPLQKTALCIFRRMEKGSEFKNSCASFICITWNAFTTTPGNKRSHFTYMAVDSYLLIKSHIATKWNQFETSCFWRYSTFHNSIVSSFLTKPNFVFAELHAENLKNEDEIDTGLLGMYFIVTWQL